MSLYDVKSHEEHESDIHFLSLLSINQVFPITKFLKYCCETLFVFFWANICRRIKQITPNCRSREELVGEKKDFDESFSICREMGTRMRRRGKF